MSSLISKIQVILNATDYIHFIELLHLFDKNNQYWILNFLNSFLEYPDHNDQWHIFINEPSEYADISEEIFDIVDGFICTVNKSDGHTTWDVYGLKRINQK